MFAVQFLECVVEQVLLTQGGEDGQCDEPGRQLERVVVVLGDPGLQLGVDDPDIEDGEFFEVSHTQDHVVQLGQGFFEQGVDECVLDKQIVGGEFAARGSGEQGRKGLLVQCGAVGVEGAVNE